MRSSICSTLLIIIVFVELSIISSANKVTLASKDFQKEFLENLSKTIKTKALDSLNNYLKEIEKPVNAQEDFDFLMNLAFSSPKLEPKVVFIKQYLDMAEYRDASRANMYALRNVNFLKKLKDKIQQLEEESFEEIHQLRYFYLCKQFKVQQKKKKANHHNYYTSNPPLVPLNGQINPKDNYTISVNITNFGNELYEKVKQAGSDVIDDYLIIIRKLLKEVLEPQSEEEATEHSEALRKILAEIEMLLQTKDFYAKRQRLYNYLQNQLAVDYEQIQSSESSQHDLMEIFSKLKEKGLDLVAAFLFSNFEFVDYVQDQWKVLLPQGPISMYDDFSRPLKNIQQLYSEFKQDYENSTKYDAFLEAVRLLHKQTLEDGSDTSHIFEMLYSASQNVGSSRAVLVFYKCNEF